MRITFIIYALIWVVLKNRAEGFGANEEKFIKKYAMMKVYESCFGPQLLKEIRKEMKDAANKCSDLQVNTNDKYFIKEETEVKRVPTTDWLQEPPYKIKPNLGTNLKKPIHTTDTLLLQQWTEEQKQNIPGDSIAGSKGEEDQEDINIMENEKSTPATKPIDFSKLQEAIINIGKPSPPLGVQKPSSNSNFQSPAVGYYPAMYYPPPVPFAPSYPYPPYYTGFFQSPGSASSAAFQTFYRSGQRSSKVTNFNTRVRKQFDLKSRIDPVIFQYTSKIRNITCIMQELGYLDENLNPNYSKMSERINRLNLEEEIKRDMLDGIKFCKEFSQCVPETRRDSFQLSRELLRPMFFFRCYKHKKLESCIMKDIRERFSQSTEFNNHFHRSFKNNEIANTLFDSIFNAYGDDLDVLF